MKLPSSPNSKELTSPVISKSVPLKEPLTRRLDGNHGLTLPQSARLKKRFHFSKVMRAGTKFHGELVTIHYSFGKAERPRLGLTISRHYGKAHVRNRLKRCTREAFRRIQGDFPKNLEINITPRKESSIPSTELALKDFKQFLAALK